MALHIPLGTYRNQRNGNVSSSLYAAACPHPPLSVVETHESGGLLSRSEDVRIGPWIVSPIRNDLAVASLR